MRSPLELTTPATDHRIWFQNGRWNNYSQPEYRAAFAKIHGALSQNETLRQMVAIIWDMSCDESGERATEWKSWYPGDAYVDWWGVNGELVKLIPLILLRMIPSPPHGN